MGSGIQGIQWPWSQIISTEDHITEIHRKGQKHFWPQSEISAKPLVKGLRFFGHLARSAHEEDHHRVIAAALRPPTDWRRPVGRPRTTWLRTIDEDVQPLNFGVHTAWRKARDRDTWHQVVSTATLCSEFATKKKKTLCIATGPSVCMSVRHTAVLCLAERKQNSKMYTI